MMVKEKNYLINEAAKEVHVESHVLRYWEEELRLPIKRNEQGHRIYTQEDIDTFITVKKLKDQGLQLKAVKMILDSDKEEQEDMKRLLRYVYNCTEAFDQNQQEWGNESHTVKTGRTDQLEGKSYDRSEREKSNTRRETADCIKNEGERKIAGRERR